MHQFRSLSVIPLYKRGNNQYMIAGDRSNKQVATWLLIGVGMTIIQIALGGIARLTEEQLS